MQFDDFTLMIRHSGSAYFEHFSTLDALKEELARHLGPKDIKRGAMQKLTTFSKYSMRSGYIQNDWANITVCAYLAD